VRKVKITCDFRKSLKRFQIYSLFIIGVEVIFKMKMVGRSSKIYDFKFHKIIYALRSNKIWGVIFHASDLSVEVSHIENKQ